MGLASFAWLLSDILAAIVPDWYIKQSKLPPVFVVFTVKVTTQTTQLFTAMPKKSNNDKKKEAEAAGRKPKLTKQQENAGKSATQKKAEQKQKKIDKAEKNKAW